MISLNIPNLLTFLRMILIPVIVIVFYIPWSGANYFCAIIFLLASFTDFLDGLLARKLGQMTKFGAFIDPVADKLMVAISLSMLIEKFHILWVTIPAIIIIGREIVISALREWMAEIGKSCSITVNIIGKLKTSVQMISIFILLISGVKINALTLSGLIALYLAAMLTIWSMFVYLYSAWKILRYPKNL